MSSLLLDERSAPSLREVLGSCLARASEADFAVARIRLAAVDLTTDEFAGITTCRVLVGRLDVESLSDPGRPASEGPQTSVLLRLFDSRRLEVRAAGLQAWYPDFSVLRGLVGGGSVAFLGAHYLARPHPIEGPTLTCVLTDPAQTASASARFEQLWRDGYDVSTVVRTALQRSVQGPG